MKACGVQIKLFFAVTAMLVISGCSLISSGYKQVNYYDIGKPSTECEDNFSVTIQPFFNSSPASMKFYYRKDNYSVVTDDYNKWTQNPEGMLTRYLNTYFSHDIDSNMATDANKDYTISGTITNFEIDLSKKEICFSAEYNIKKTETNKSVRKDYFSVKIPFTESKAEVFAAAFSNAEKKFAEQIKSDLSNLKTK